jgi:hypothetical protein
MKFKNALTHGKIVNFKPSAKIKSYADGGGLSILVSPKGSKCWRLKYKIGSKNKSMSLGVFPEIDLETAREMRDAYRLIIKEGIDPSDKRQHLKQPVKAIRHAKLRCFKNCYLEKGHHGCALNLINKYNYFFSIFEKQTDKQKIFFDYMKFVVETIDELNTSVTDLGLNSEWLDDSEMSS